MSEENAQYVGDFELPLDAVVTSTLPVATDIVFEIKKSERKEYDVKDENKQPTGKKAAYFNFQLAAVDFPGEMVFHKFFPTAKNLASRDASRSYKLFLDKLELPYTTHPADNAMAGIRFVGHVREDKVRGEYIISQIVGKA